MQSSWKKKSHCTIRNIEQRSPNHCCCEKSNNYYIYWVCVCSFSYSACKKPYTILHRITYCHPWPVWLYHIFRY